ncbi:MAG: hypothetical protein ACLQVA_15325 [Candidatus Brocadiia bacterium]
MTKTIGLCVAGLALAATLCQAQTTPPAMTLTKMDAAKEKDWLARWDKEIISDTKAFRECDHDVGEDIAFGMTPAMDGFYYGYMATKNPKYVDMLVDWADSLIKRAVKEPDGYVGWPSKGAAGTPVDNLDDYNADSMLSDAMVFRPIVLMANEMVKNPALKRKYGAKGESYLKLAEQLYAKWVERGGWRETKDGGMISMELPYGMDATHQKWIDFDTRNDPGRGFSHPDNKANEVARWMLAMWDVTGKPEYKERAERWYKVQKSRMTLNSDGTYAIWNYWQPAGPWDYKEDGSPKLWIGTHPNGGYYSGDTRAIVAAFEHGLVFTKTDIDALIATAKTGWVGGDPGNPAAGMTISVQAAGGTAKEINACFPNSKTSGPPSVGAAALEGTVVSVQWDVKALKGKLVVQPKDAQAAQVTLDTDKDTKVQVLRMWTALVPYDIEIQKNFEATATPDTWFGLSSVPYFLMLQSELRGK